MTDSEHDKTAALHEIAEEVEQERDQRGRSPVDGQPVVSNAPDVSEPEGDVVADDVLVVPPVRPSGN